MGKSTTFALAIVLGVLTAPAEADPIVYEYEDLVKSENRNCWQASA